MGATGVGVEDIDSYRNQNLALVAGKTNGETRVCRAQIKTTDSNVVGIIVFGKTINTELASTLPLLATFV